MPTISKFYGIVIRMMRLRDFGARFHAIYENSELIVNLWPLKIVAGEAPARVKDMVLEWAAQHQQELLMAWNKLQVGEQPIAIEPLK
ncbi:MAG TPA: DUF4160 domain-containing protein [Verrucomicrobiae bacterium]|nr:DUF4160 domain-containing protein [Verrucomicrobiae bacterium]